MVSEIPGGGGRNQHRLNLIWMLIPVIRLIPFSKQQYFDSRSDWNRSTVLCSIKSASRARTYQCQWRVSFIILDDQLHQERKIQLSDALISFSKSKPGRLYLTSDLISEVRLMVDTPVSPSDKTLTIQITCNLIS